MIQVALGGCSLLLVMYIVFTIIQVFSPLIEAQIFPFCTQVALCMGCQPVQTCPGLNLHHLVLCHCATWVVLDETAASEKLIKWIM